MSLIIGGQHMSCGVWLLQSIHLYSHENIATAVVRESIENNIKAILGVWGSRQAAQIMFSDFQRGDNSRGGFGLATYIISQGLGTVVRSEGATNANTGNTIYVWVWTPDWNALKTKFMVVAEEQIKVEKGFTLPSLLTCTCDECLIHRASAELSAQFEEEDRVRRVAREFTTLARVQEYKKPKQGVVEA